MPIYDSPNWSTQRLVNLSISRPIRELPDYGQFLATFEGPRDTYQPTQLDTQAPLGLGITGRLLMETDPQQIDGDQYRYTRVYGLPPPPHSIRQSYVADFPAVQFERNAFTRKVTSRLLCEYERVAGLPQGGGFVQPAQNMENFPFQPTPVFEILSDDGFLTNVLRFSNDLRPTTPTAEDYLNNTVGTEIAIESDVELWMGNIYRRVTRYVIAQ